MRRREFIALVGGALWPLVARAQQLAMPVIGFLGAETPELYPDRLRAFAQGMKETGYIEGQNVAVEYRWAEGQNDRLPVLAAELVNRQVTIIVAGGGTPSALAAKAATATIPVVFGVAVDPVEVGLVASLNRPGGNVTGVTNLNVEIGPKRLELLRELIPGATDIAVLVNPTSPIVTGQFLRDMQAAATTVRLQLHVLHASTERDFDTAFSTLAQLRASALVIAPDNFFYGHFKELAAMALGHSMPVISQNRSFARAGALITYGGSETEYYRLVGIYTGKILNGEKPGTLPVQQTTKVELIINLKTAKAIGLTILPSLLARADEVIE
jgi:putative tryptophan/tyrosine transport system substrate-binding protein